MFGAGLQFMAVAAALIAGLASGQMLDTGQVIVTSWTPFLLAVAVAMSVFDYIRYGKSAAVIAGVWTLAGGWLSVLVLCSVALQIAPSDFLRPAKRATVAPREKLALSTGLDLFWGRSRTLAELEKGFEVDRLDIVSPVQLARHRYMLLAQPRLLAPEELVAFDEWLRAGGKAVILADPLLLWPSDLPAGDRRRPPVTSLLDPLLAHWGLRLEAADSSMVQRQFVGDKRLLVVQGASRFILEPSRFAQCKPDADGLSVACRVGKGQARLVADADLLNHILWLAEDGHALSGDNMTILGRWLHEPLSEMAAWPEAPYWIRNTDEVANGLRWGLGAAFLWSVAGAVLFASRRGVGKAGKRRFEWYPGNKDEEQT